jgi:hypothetical protein
MKKLHFLQFFICFLVLGISSTTLLAQDCTGPGQLIYDDGTFENGYNWGTTGPTDGRFVSLFTPSEYPWQFNTFCLALSRLPAGFDQLTFDIVMYDGTGGGVPGAEIAIVTGVTATLIPPWPDIAFYSYDISTMPAVTSGSVYIGIKYDPSLNTTQYSCADESVSTPLHPGYVYNGSSWNTIETLFPGYRALGYRTLGSSDPTTVVELGAPAFYSLEQNYPNPFNPSTKIVFNLATDSKVTLKIFDVLGQEMTEIVSSKLNAGRHEYTFDASQFNSGVYFYRIDVEGNDGSSFSKVKKMLLTK